MDVTTPPLLCLHGFMGRGNDWAPLQSALPEFSLITPDLPGHGQSIGVPPQTYSFDGHLKFVLKILDEAGIPRCPIAGYSMGARLALFCALRRPGRFTAVISISGSPGIRSDVERIQRLNADEVLAQKLESISKPSEHADFLKAWWRQPVFQGVHLNAELWEEMTADRLKQDPIELANSLRGVGIGKQPDLWPELKAIPLPLLAIAGTEDPKFSHIADEMALCSGRIQQIVLPCGHMPHVETPAGLAGAIRRFLQSVAD